MVADFRKLTVVCLIQALFCFGLPVEGYAAQQDAHYIAAQSETENLRAPVQMVAEGLKALETQVQADGIHDTQGVEDLLSQARRNPSSPFSPLAFLVQSVEPRADGIHLVIDKTLSLPLMPSKPLPETRFRSDIGSVQGDGAEDAEHTNSRQTAQAWARLLIVTDPVVGADRIRKLVDRMDHHTDRTMMIQELALGALRSPHSQIIGRINPYNEALAAEVDAQLEEWREDVYEVISTLTVYDEVFDLQEILDRLAEYEPLETHYGGDITRFLDDAHLVPRSIARRWLVRRIVHVHDGESSLFRLPWQYRVLEEQLPLLIEELIRRGEKKLRILSLGSSTGEEALSLATLVAWVMEQYPEWEKEHGLHVEVKGIEFTQSRVNIANSHLTDSPIESLRISDGLNDDLQPDEIPIMLQGWAHAHKTWGEIFLALINHYHSKSSKMVTFIEASAADQESIFSIREAHVIFSNFATSQMPGSAQQWVMQNILQTQPGTLFFTSSGGGRHLPGFESVDPDIKRGVWRKIQDPIVGDGLVGDGVDHSTNKKTTKRKEGLPSFLEPPDDMSLEQFRGQELGRLINYLIGMGLSVEESEDVIHDVWLKFYKVRDRFGSEVNFNPYLYQAIRHAAWDFLKRRARYADDEVSDEIVDDNTPIPLELLIESPLAEAIRHIPNIDQRQAAELRYFKDLTNAEIASRLSESPMTIGTRLMRARAFIKKYLLDKEALSKTGHVESKEHRDPIGDGLEGDRADMSDKQQQAFTFFSRYKGPIYYPAQDTRPSADAIQRGVQLDLASEDALEHITASFPDEALVYISARPGLFLIPGTVQVYLSRQEGEIDPEPGLQILTLPPSVWEASDGSVKLREVVQAAKSFNIYPNYFVAYQEVSRVTEGQEVDEILTLREHLLENLERFIAETVTQQGLDDDQADTLRSIAALADDA